jgi:CSLREA domain-containing protein
MLHRTLSSALLSASIAAAGVLFGSTAHAAVTITVNTTADNTTDNNLCSLREAIYSANNWSSLNGDCPAGSSTGTIIKLGSATYSAATSFDLLRPVTIRGNGVGSTIIRGNLAAGTSSFFSVLYVGGEAAFERVTIDGGTLGGDTTGISAYGDTVLRLQEAAVRDFTNSGVKAFGMSVILDRSSLFYNSAIGDGGGIQVASLWGALGALHLNQSSIHDNDASGYGGGICFTAGSNNQWNDSTISSNYAGTLGGGVYIETPAGGSYVQMNRLTIASNDAFTGGGIYESSSSFGSFYIFDTIVGDNTATTGAKDGSVTLSGAQDTLFEVSSGVSYLTGSGMILGVDPKLDPLQTWPTGVPTKVHPLRSTSPAVNVKSWSASTIDQRGLPRGVGAGVNKFDIGAFERQ